ncbi:MAG: tetratricopeptide repeat protein [Gemmatimonadales bacterium]|nr:tetratricopeptide repeat protein [Gemmatimonadales bacterium]
MLTFAGWTSCFYSNYADARGRWEQSLPLHRALGDDWGEGVALHSLGYAAWLSGDSNQAAQLLEEALAIQTPLGDQRGLADSLHQLANVVLYQGQFEKAERLARESAAISRTIVDRKTFGEGCRALGMALVVQGRYAEGCSALEEGATIFAGLDWANEQEFQTIWQGRALMHLGQYDRAHSFGQRCLDTARYGGLGREIGLLLLLQGDLALVEGAHGEADEKLQQSLAVLQEIGYRPELSSALASRAIAALGLGNTAQAQEHLQQALRECYETRMVFPLLRALPAAALLLAHTGDAERAVELYALASRYPFVANSRWYASVVGPHIAAAAQERGRARDLWETVTELL